MPGQSASLAQPAHCDDSGSQERPAQAPELEAVHVTQAPVAASQAGMVGRAAQFRSLPHGEHWRLDGSQTGSAAGQSLSARQPAHVEVAASQATSPQAWALNGVHSTQLPVAGLQASNPGRSAQSPSLVQVRQRSATGSHTGLEAGQSASSRQPTQVELCGSHSGLEPRHASASSGVHSTQPPFAASQAKASARPAQAPSLVQPPQVPAATSHCGA